MVSTALDQFRRVNDEVYYALSPLSLASRATIEELKAVARQNARGRARICFHASPEALLHDMLIALCSTTSYQPHKHLNKAEAFHLIEGRLRVVLFSDDGVVENSFELAGANDAGAVGVSFYCRIPVNKFHTVVPLSETVVFREVTDGPFMTEETIFSSWPDDSA